MESNLQLITATRPSSSSTGSHSPYAITIRRIAIPPPSAVSKKGLGKPNEEGDWEATLNHISRPSGKLTKTDGKELKGKRNAKITTPEPSAMESRDPSRILPEEVWRIIFSYLDNHLDLHNICNASAHFNLILALEKRQFLFGGVFRNLFSYLEDPEVLACRRVSKTWKDGVSKQLIWMGIRFILLGPRRRIMIKCGKCETSRTFLWRGSSTRGTVCKLCQLYIHFGAVNPAQCDLPIDEIPVQKLKRKRNRDTNNI